MKRKDSTPIDLTDFYDDYEDDDSELEDQDSNKTNSSKMSEEWEIY